jgi:hypothetical protein
MRFSFLTRTSYHQQIHYGETSMVGPILAMLAFLLFTEVATSRVVREWERRTRLAVMQETDAERLQCPRFGPVATSHAHLAGPHHPELAGAIPPAGRLEAACERAA